MYKFTLFFYRRVIMRKMRKLKKTNTHWHGDSLYNQAIDDCIKIVFDNGINNPCYVMDIEGIKIRGN